MFGLETVDPHVTGESLAGDHGAFVFCEAQQAEEVLGRFDIAHDKSRMIEVFDHDPCSSGLPVFRIRETISSDFVAFRSAKAATFAERKATLIDSPILGVPFLLRAPW